MRAVLAMAVLAGCFSPSVPTGVPCGPGGRCPDGQECELATNICEGVTGRPDGGGVVDPDGPSDGCDPGEDFIDGACTVVLDSEVPPAPVSAEDCTTGDANGSRSVGIDAANRIYVAFRCGNNDDVFVVARTASAAAPQPIGVAGARGVALVGGVRKTAYLAVGGTQGVALAVTVDGGVTWTTQTLATQSPDGNFAAAVGAFGDRVYVAASFGNIVRVWRNGNRGIGAFDSVDVALDHVYGDMLVDPVSGDVWVGGDTPRLHVRKSSDGGASFAPVIDPPASYNVSEWAMNGTTIFASGQQDTFTRIEAADPSNATTVNAMLPNVAGRGRALAAAADGALYVASQPSSGDWSLQRFPAGAASATARMPGTGSGPSVVAGPGTAAPFVFTEAASTRVLLGVAVF